MPTRKAKNLPEERKNIAGANVAKIRLSKELSQKQLSDIVSDYGVPMDQKKLSSIELGHRFLCDYELVAFAEVFDMTMEELLEYSE